MYHRSESYSKFFFFPRVAEQYLSVLDWLALVHHHSLEEEGAEPIPATTPAPVQAEEINPEM